MTAQRSGPRVTHLQVGAERLAVLSFPLGPAADLAVLTSAERDVAERASAGASNRAIAAARRTSERTVANQLASIFQKLGVGSRAELAAKLRSS